MPGQQILRRIGKGESHFYQVSVNNGQYFRILVEPLKTRIKSAFQSPENGAVVEWVCQRNKPTSFSAIASISRPHFLKINLSKDESAAGSYKVSLEELRNKMPLDQFLIAAERSFNEGERLCAVGELESQRKAIKKYEEARWFWKQAGDQWNEALALRSLGEIFFALGDSQTALDYQKQSLSACRNVEDRQGEGHALNAIASILISHGKIEAARKTSDQAFELGVKTGNHQIQAQAIYNVAETSSWSGNLQEAIRYYYQALTLWCDLNDFWGQAQTLTALGYSYSEMGEQLKALCYHEPGLLLRQAIKDRRGEAQSLYALGRLYTRLGDSQKALNHFNQAMPIAELVGDRIEQASIHNGIGYVYESLDEKQQALKRYYQAHNLFESIDHFRGEAGTLSEIGRCHYSMGNNRKALETFGVLLSKARSSSNQRLVAYALRGLGMAYDSEGQKMRALAYYRKALPFFRAGKNRRAEATLLNLSGRIYQGHGQRPKALKHYQRALQLNQAAGDKIGESLTLYNLASLESARGHEKQALMQIRAALQIVESLRNKVASRDLRATYFASIQQYYELYLDLLMQQWKRNPSDALVVEALEANERARMRSLLDLLAEAHADIRWKGDPGLIERAQKLQKDIQIRADRKTSLLSANASSDELAAVSQEISSLTVERDQVETQIRIKTPRYAALTQPQPASLKEIQQLLDDNTLLLEFALGSERSYLWAVTPTGLKSYQLPSREKIERLARPVYELLASLDSSPVRSEKQREEEFWRRATKLSELILKPIAAQLGHKRLLVVADGILQYIPFAALPIPGKRQQEKSRPRNPQFTPLIVEHEIINLPSASTLAVLRRETAGRKPAPKAVAVLADPVFETDDMRVLAATGKIKSTRETNQIATKLPILRGRRGGSFVRLPATLNEAKAIEDVTSAADRLVARGFDASLARVTSSELSQYRILHFATHGILDRENPELSAIVLSLVDRQGNPQNGYLRLHDIYNLNLPADLVVLSACDTGLGKEFKGEGLVGLTRGFMYAGALRVMASLWKVEDEPTAKLMKLFYQGMLKDKLSAAAALRQAQIALWQDAQWHAPYFWAAFTLQGEWK